MFNLKFFLISMIATALVLVVGTCTRTKTEIQKKNDLIEKISGLRKIETRIQEINGILEIIQGRDNLRKLDIPLNEAFKLYQEAKQQFETDDIRSGKPFLQAAENIIENSCLEGLLKHADSLFYEKENNLKDKLRSSLLKNKIKLQYWDTLGLERKKLVRWGWRPLSAIKSIILHHTDELELKQIHSKHTSQGYLDKKGAPFIAYHFLIQKNGTILWLNPLQDRVWHARDANFHTIGVAIHGSLTNTPSTRKQIESLKALIHALESSLGSEKLSIIGHGELTEYGNDTECPGKYGQKLVELVSKPN